MSAQLLESGAAGAPTSLLDTEDLKLADISAMTTGSIGETGFLFAASASENAVTALVIEADGTLTPAGWVGAADGLGLSAPSQIVFAEVAGAAYVIAASQTGGALSVLSLASDGTLDVADHVTDGLATRFGGTSALAVHYVGGKVFVVAGGADDGVSLFVLIKGGRLVHLSSIEDTNSLSLQNVTALGLFDSGGSLQITSLSAV